MLKVSRETMCWQKQTMLFFTADKKVSRETFVKLREKRVSRPFYASILMKKCLLNMILLLLVGF